MKIMHMHMRMPAISPAVHLCRRHTFSKSALKETTSALTKIVDCVSVSTVHTSRACTCLHLFSFINSLWRPCTFLFHTVGVPIPVHMHRPPRCTSYEPPGPRGAPHTRFPSRLCSLALPVRLGRPPELLGSEASLFFRVIASHPQHPILPNHSDAGSASPFRGAVRARAGKESEHRAGRQQDSDLGV